MAPEAYKVLIPQDNQYNQPQESCIILIFPQISVSRTVALQ